MVKLDYVDRHVSRGFSALGGTVSRRPLVFIVLPLIASLVSVRLLLGVDVVRDAEYLFTPTNGPAKGERQLVETLFPMDYSTNFDLSRSTRFGKYGKVIVTSLDENSLLRKEAFREIVALDTTIHDIAVSNGTSSWTYNEICAKKNKRCFENSVIELWKDIDRIGNGSRKIMYPLSVDVDTFAVETYGMSLGDVVTAEDGSVTSARAMLLHYILDEDTYGVEVALSWERAFLNAVADFPSKHIRLSRYASSTLIKEMQENVVVGRPYFTAMISMMMIFSVSACLARDCVRSKPLLGAAGCLSCLLGVGTGMSLCLIAGLPFFTTNMSIPFLLLGIGMDDTFVLLAAWRRTDPSRSVEDRMRETYRHAGVSITITSLTNLLSFAVGATGPFSSMFIFCTYTAVSVVTTFIFQITFFGGLMALLGRAERDNRHGLTLRPAVPVDRAGKRSWMFRLLCTGGSAGEETKPNPPHAGMVFFRDRIGGALSKTGFKILVMGCFLLYLAGALYGCTQVKEGLDTQNLFGTNSYAVDYFTYLRSYFTKYPYRIQVVVNRTIDYSDPEEQGKIEAMLEEFETTPYTAGSAMSESWLRAFQRFRDHPGNRLWTSGLNRTSKTDFVQWLRFVFLRFPQVKRRFSGDIVFSADRSEIVATRYIVQARGVRDSNDAKHMVIVLRELAAKHGASVFNTYFIYHDQLTMISGLTVQATGVTAAAMLVVTLIFLPRPTCVLWVALVIASVEIGVVGYMTLWDVSLNSVSLLGLIMCIGFSVDNAAHVTYAYAIAKGNSAEERLKDALFYVGLPIVQGSVSTILGVVALSAAPSYVFTTVFKTWFLVMVFSALHSLFLLPVLLSWAGTASSSPNRKHPSIDSNDNQIFHENSLPLMTPFQDSKVLQTEL